MPSNQTSTVSARIPKAILEKIRKCPFVEIEIEQDGEKDFWAITLAGNVVATYVCNIGNFELGGVITLMMREYLSGEDAYKRLHYVLTLAKRHEADRESRAANAKYGCPFIEPVKFETFQKNLKAEIEAIEADLARFMSAIAPLNPQYVRVA